MQLRQLFQATLLAVATLSLAACAATGAGAGNGGASVENASAASDNGGVQTSGLGSSGSSDNGGIGNLPNPNAMVPGANQTYYFDFNKSNVHSTDLPSIKVQAQYLNSHANAKASLQGNTDVRGSREYNMALGQRRADAVLQALALAGANKNQLSTVSYGAERPNALGHTERDYALNRRVNMVYKGN